MAKQSPASTWTKNIVYKVANLKKTVKLGLEPLLVEIEKFLNTTQKYETPGFFKCQNAHRPPQPQEGQET